MDELYLDLDEGIILEDTDVERYCEKDISLDEMILTNKSLIFVYDFKSGLFSKSEKRVERLPLSLIKIVDNKVQVKKIEHDDYGDVLRILFTNGKREYFSFYKDESITVWINAIRQATTGEEPIIIQPVSKKSFNVFSFMDNIQENFKSKNDYNSNNNSEKTEDVKHNTTVNQNGAPKTDGNISEDNFIFCVSCGKKLNADSNFCSFCGKPVLKNNQSQNKRQQEFVGKVYKCPNCGCVISETTAICPSCGMKISLEKDRKAFNEFQAEISKLEYQYKDSSLLGAFKELGGIFVGRKNPIVPLIKNYPIPDSVDVMVEFVIYANMCIENTTNGDEQYAWYSKIKQTYIKAKISFPNEPEFKKIEKIYFSNKKEYDSD